MRPSSVFTRRPSCSRKENSGTVNYVLAFENNWQDQTANPYIGAVGKTATVKGESALRYGLYQFSNFEVTTGGDSSLALPEPETFDAEAIEKYASEIKADESKAAYKYVKVSGILGIEKGASYNTYTLEIPGLTTVKTVAFAYGLDSYFEGLESGDVVDATGFALGYDTSNSKLNILLREIDANTTTPAVTFTKEPEPLPQRIRSSRRFPMLWLMLQLRRLPLRLWARMPTSLRS